MKKIMIKAPIKIIPPINDPVSNLRPLRFSSCFFSGVVVIAGTVGGTLEVQCCVDAGTILLLKVFVDVKSDDVLTDDEACSDGVGFTGGVVKEEDSTIKRL